MNKKMRFALITFAVVLFPSAVFAQECVDTAALAAYIVQWKTDSTTFTMPQLMLKIADWKSGAGCNSQACSNNVREGTDVCDGTDLNNQACATQGFTSGTLSCNENCQSYNFADCSGGTHGNEYYVDTVNGSDSNPGTIIQPWRTWFRAQSALKSGDALYVAGNLGDVTLGTDAPIGAASAYIEYRNWLGREAPQISHLEFTGSTNRSVYIKFVGFRFDPGFVSGSIYGGKPTVLLGPASYVTFDSCYFEGAKNNLAGLAGADFYPYTFNDIKIIVSAPYHVAYSSNYITINQSTFLYGSTQISVVNGNHWTIANSEFSEQGDNAVQFAINGGDYSLIKGNYFHHGNQYRQAFTTNNTNVITGDWTGKEGKKVTQDRTGATGIYAGAFYGKYYFYGNDKTRLFAGGVNDTWRLDEDPAVSWTPSYLDPAHTDSVSLEGKRTGIIIENNRFYKVTGQHIKLGSSPSVDEITDVLIQNNLLYDDAPVTYMIIIQSARTAVLYNNTIDSGSANPFMYRGLRVNGSPQSTLVELYNNVISGAVYTQGTISGSNNNIWATTPPVQFAEGTNSLINQDFASGLFVDRANSNYNLASNSSAIGRADSSHASAFDITGVARDTQPDIGAYEYR